MTKRKIVITVSLTVLISAGMLVMILASQMVRAGATGSDTEPTLTLKVQTLKPKYQKLEPIGVKFRVLNETPKTVTWAGFVGIGPSMNLLVKHNGGPEVLWEGSKLLQVLVGQIPVDMQPGAESASVSTLLPMDLVSKVFPDAGEYAVRFQLLYTEYSPEGQQRKATSDEIRIIVLEPEGADRQAYQSASEILIAAKTGKSDAEVLALKQTFVDTFPQSIYAKFLGYELADVYEALGQNDKALRELCKLPGADFQLSEQTRVKLMQVDRKLHPDVLVPNLAEDATPPKRPDPCMAVRKPT